MSNSRPYNYGISASLYVFTPNYLHFVTSYGLPKEGGVTWQEVENTALGYAYRSGSVDLEEHSESTNLGYFSNANVSRDIELGVYIEGISVNIGVLQLTRMSRSDVIVIQIILRITCSDLYKIRENMRLNTETLKH